MRLLMLVLILVIFSATVVQLRDLYHRDIALRVEDEHIVKKVSALAAENMDLGADIAYFSESKNLEKEARNQLNYGRPGERLIIVIPKKTP